MIYTKEGERKAKLGILRKLQENGPPVPGEFDYEVDMESGEQRPVRKRRVDKEKAEK